MTPHEAWTLGVVAGRLTRLASKLEAVGINPGDAAADVRLEIDRLVGLVQIAGCYDDELRLGIEGKAR